jgi:hypothetical protein
MRKPQRMKPQKRTIKPPFVIWGSRYEEKVLNTATADAKADFKEVLETICAELNHGQLKKLVKNEKIKKAFDRFGVTYEE